MMLIIMTMFAQGQEKTSISDSQKTFLACILWADSIVVLVATVAAYI